MKKFILLIAFLTLLITACSGVVGLDVADDPTPPQEALPTVEPVSIPMPTLDDTVVEAWQEAYATLLRDYEEKTDPKREDRMFFLLHDIDMDGIPELIVFGECDNEMIDVTYTFADESLISLEYGENVSLSGYAIGARRGITATVDNSPGLIKYEISPSAGMLGSSIRLT